MDSAAVVVAVVVGVIAGWVFPGYQHVLYSEPEYRAAPASGKTLLALRVFCMVSAGTTLGLAFRPGLYDFGPAAVTGACLLVLVAVSSTDFERRRIPNVVTYPAFVVAMALCWAWPDRSVGNVFLGAGVGLAVGVVLVGLGIVLGGSGMGLGVGDGKLMLLLGAMIGWPGIMPALLYGMILGGVVAVTLLVRKGRNAAFSYGPYLAAGGAIALLFPGVR